MDKHDKNAPVAGHNDTYTTQLRMPVGLEERTREFSAKTGASINAVVCIALDAFLRDSGL